MTRQNENPVLKAALEDHQRGWCIIPIKVGTKRAAVKWEKYQKERPSEAQLRKWFGSGKYTSLAVVLGEVSGWLACRDFDAMPEYELWAGNHLELAKTLPTVQTARGRHVYFRQKQIDGIKKLTGGELRCSRGYCLLPPSIHPSGSVYQWLIPPNGELPELSLKDFDITDFTKERDLEPFGIETLEKPIVFTEETEDREDSEDSKDIERHTSHKVVGLNRFSKEVREEIEKAIQNTIPTQEHQRNDAVLPLCQWLKAIPELRKLSAANLKPIVVEWHKRALLFIGTKAFTDTWADFVHCWSRVKWPKGEVMVSQAIKRVLEGKTVLPDANEYDTKESRCLLKLCYELQQGVGDKPFFLASRKAGGIIGVSHTTAYKLLEMFVADGKLVVAEKYTTLTRRATRYRYVGS